MIKKKIVVLTATKRGYKLLQNIHKLLPEAEVTVFSFKEEAWEPPFFADLKDLAKKYNYEFYETKNIGSLKWISFWQKNVIDLMLVASWRYLIPSSIYSIPTHGTYVFHDSLLPKYRGFAPTVWALINNENQTGVTLFKIADEVDSGDIIDQEVIKIKLDDDIAKVMDRVTLGYIRLLKNNIFSLLDGKAKAVPQNHSEATYTCKRIPDDNCINWNLSSLQIYNLIRASTYPYPGAFTFLMNHKIRVWSSRIINEKKFVGSIPGRVVEIISGIGSVVLTGNGAILIKNVQFDDGGEIITADQIINSITLTLG